MIAWHLDIVENDERVLLIKAAGKRMVELVKAGRGAVAVLLNALRCFCFEVQTGKHLLGLNLAAFDPHELAESVCSGH